MTQLTGRVFSRLQQYDALPTELKREVEALEKHLTATQREVFSSHPTLKLKTVHGVKTDALLEKIEAWYKLHGKEFSQTHSHGVGHGHHGTATGTATGKAHAAAHNAKEDVKHAVGRDTTYDQTHGTGHGVTRDQTYGTGRGVTRDQTYGTGHGVTRDQTYGTGHGATTDPTTATGKVHNAAHNVKQDVKHAMGRDNTYDPNYDQTRGYAATGDNMGRNYDGTGHGMTGDRHHGTGYDQTHGHHGTGHGVAHDVKQDVKHAMGRDQPYDQTYDQTRGHHVAGYDQTQGHHGAGYDQTQGHHGAGYDQTQGYQGTGYDQTHGHHGTTTGKAHVAAHNVKEDVKHAMGRDHTYDPKYDQTRGNYDTATGAPTSAAHTAGTTGTAAGAGAMTGPGPTTHQTTPNTTAAHSTNPNVGNYQVAGSATPATAPVQPVQSSHMHGGAIGGGHSHAKHLLDALVLKGFVTPHKEPKPEDAGVPTPTKHTGATTTGALIKDLELSGNTLLVARAPSIADEKTKEKGPSVWDVVDGAVFAGMVKRKAGLIEKVIHGKETYVVVNERLHSLTVFKSDVSRKSITQLFNRGLQVAFDDSHAEHGYSHGVKVWNGADSELLFTTSQQERDALARALVQIGASQNGVRGIDAAPTGMKAKADKMGHDVKHAVGADRHHETHGHTTGQPYNQSYNADKRAGEGIMGGEHRGHHSPTMATATRSATHTSDNMMKTTPEGGVETQQYQQPEYHHGMDKLGLGDHHHHHQQQQYQPQQQQQYQPQQQQYQQQYQQNPQHGMTADNAHVKRDVGAPRGYTQGIEPTVAP